jgi:DNA-directed RNA polymerase subunit RPC12/RpoP
MSERYQTLFTRLRPHRIAILTNVNDPMWQESCISIIEFLSQLWGGYHSLIIPTDGKTIDIPFWKFLSAFDPDAIYFYNRSFKDLKRWAPAEAESRMDAELNKLRALGHEGLKELNLREQMLQWPIDPFSVSPELTRQLLDRLSPFHFQGFYNVLPIRMGDTPGYPLTKVTDVVPFVDSPDALFVLSNNLPQDREAPPSLWLFAETGVASDQFQKDLNEVGVTSVPKYMNTETDGAIIDWGIKPVVKLGPNTPFSFSRLALANVRSRFAHPFAIPSVIVRGDTIKDVCLYYAISRNNGRAIWLPQWFIPTADEFPSSLISAVRKLEKIARSQHYDYFSLLSMSATTAELSDLAALVRRHISNLSLNIDDGNDPHYLDRMLQYPSKVYIKKNIDRITTHQIVDEKLQGYCESPMPAIFSEIKASKHRWVGEISFAGHPLPRHPELGRILATGPNMQEAGAGIDGLAYQFPGALVQGDDVELQMLRFSISLPSSDNIFQIVLKECGYESVISDRGAYASESTQKFDGLDNIVSVLRDPKKKSLLKKFMDGSENKEGVHDQGTFLRDNRRYLDFEPISAILGSEEQAISLIDEWIAREILYRGFIFKCARCSNTAWFSAASVTQEFICPRCGTMQQYKRSNWINSNEPRWQYKLDEIVFQFLHHDGDVGLLTIDALRRQSAGNFIYSPEHKLRLASDPKKNMEIDICCIMDNRIIIGEAKSNNSLKAHGKKPMQVTAKYEELARAMKASGIIFSTTEPDWDEPSQHAIAHLIKDNPLLRIYNYRSGNLKPKS